MANPSVTKLHAMKVKFCVKLCIEAAYDMCLRKENLQYRSMKNPERTYVAG